MQLRKKSAAVYKAAYHDNSQTSLSVVSITAKEPWRKPLVVPEKRYRPPKSSTRMNSPRTREGRFLAGRNLMTLAKPSFSKEFKKTSSKENS